MFWTCGCLCLFSNHPPFWRLMCFCGAPRECCRRVLVASSYLEKTMMLYFQAHIWVICVDDTNTESFLQWGLIALMVSWKHNVLWGYSLQAHVKEMLCSLCRSKSSAAAVCSSCGCEACVTPQHVYRGLSSPTSPKLALNFHRSAWFGADLIEAKTHLLGGLAH